ncbi:MAG: ABC transporter ATP-binding protein [Rhodospirillales bacterium]|nr:ABC transporter ATP-binding protein [Rhodospirillales bacterium]
MSLLEIKDLSVSFGHGPGEVKAVRNISLNLEKGETVALVGESGSGKSVTALSVMKLLPYPQAHHPSGSIRFSGEELIGADEAHMRSLRGDRIAMIFQEPLTSLNPLHSIEKQISEVLFVHKLMTRAQAHTRVLELLELVGLEEAMDRLDALPHQFSGGQQQRVMIAMALANEPDLLIADEPTTAVDVTIQAQLLKLLNELRDKLGMALLLITHDLGVVRVMADKVSVMNEGRIVEQGDARDVLGNPQDPYTKALLAAEPKGAPEPADPSAPALMSGKDIKVWFPIKQGLLRRTTGHVKAVDGVTMSVKRGHTLGVVGESGSGKSTLARALLRLESCQGGIVFEGEELDKIGAAELRPKRRRMQLVFQDPYGSLSPRLSIGQIVGEGLKVHNMGGTAEERHALIAETLKEVGLEAEMMGRYPHEFSGGQRQRIAIARVLVLKPDFIVMDEPTSALDMSVQAQIVELLRDLQQRHGLTYLFISHDLKVVRAVAHDIVVMRRGKIVEQGPAAEIFANPKQAYTRALMAAALEMKADETGVVGT